MAAAAVAAAVTLLSIACSSMNGPPKRTHTPEAVLGKVWRWESMVTPVERIDVPTPERYTFQLLPDGRVAARLDCNRGSGTYKISEGKIAFGPMASTRMACPPGSLDTRFARDLGRATLFFLEGGKLFLDLPMDSGTMRFGTGE